MMLYPGKLGKQVYILKATQEQVVIHQQRIVVTKQGAKWHKTLF